MPAPSIDGAPSPTPKFSDFVAILNPLQNLPIVGTIYRKLTGDEPHPAARVIGGLVWGGPLGMVGAALTYVAEQVSGKSATQLVKSIFDGTETTPAVAQGGPPAAAPETPPETATPAAGAIAAPAGTVAPPAAASAAPNLPQAQQLQQGAIQARQRNAATRDLSFYQAHAGSRVPAASSAPAPSGPQNAPQIPSFHRPVTPVLGAEPSNGSGLPVRASTPRSDGDLPAAATMPDAKSADFHQRMLQGLERYRALNRAADAKAPVLDRAE